MVRAVDWPCELFDRVRWLWDQGLTATEISEKVHKSRSAIIGKLSRARKQGAKVHTRAKVIPKKANKPKKLVAPKVSRGAANGSGEQVMPPSETVPPPPIPSPLPVINGWDGITAEIDFLQIKHCRWPLGEPVSGFCRMELDNYRHPYCEYHTDLARRKRYGKNERLTEQKE
jgi:hypothetical protein